MVLGVLGDTHGNIDLMLRAAGCAAQELGATQFIHLGDDYADAETLRLYGYDVWAVPGLWCPEYHDGRVPRRFLETVDGVTIAAAHADADLRASDRGAAIILTGHTHEARIEVIGPTLHVNPGHLKAVMSRGQPASFATIGLDTEAIHAAIHELDGRTRLERSVQPLGLG